MAARAGFEVIFFDCDSTLSTLEGIDALAVRAGREHEISALTRAAMDGEQTLESIYGRRLETLRPDRQAVAWLGNQYVAAKVPGASAVVGTLISLGKEVHIVSGGIRQAVVPLAAVLSIPLARVHAVKVFHDAAGNYTGYDASSPLTRSGGKGAVCHRVAKNRRAAIVGDGITDLDPAAYGIFTVGFGGVVRREAVQRRADAYVADRALTGVLEFLLTREEFRRLPAA
ncbi:MAG: HAD-IB family phosphatase [Pseudomonadota bacterium]|nr:HAD-IB family phosphatase [Pseudomonadota bacterium]